MIVHYKNLLAYYGSEAMLPRPELGHEMHPDKVTRTPEGIETWSKGYERPPAYTEYRAMHPHPYDSSENRGYKDARTLNVNPGDTRGQQECPPHLRDSKAGAPRPGGAKKSLTVEHASSSRS